MKKRSRKLLFGSVLILTMLAACGQGKDKEEAKLPEQFYGKWQCAESPVEQEDYYTGFLMLRIEEDSSFRMYDAEAGNPGISGQMNLISDTELLLDCNTEDDFDPPPTWTSMEEEQRVTYEFATDDELHLSYDGEEGMSTLVFQRTE